MKTKLIVAALSFALVFLSMKYQIQHMLGAGSGPLLTLLSPVHRQRISCSLLGTTKVQ